MINTDGKPATGELPGQARQPDRSRPSAFTTGPKARHTGGQIGSPTAQRYPSQPLSPSVRRAGEEFKVPVRPAIEGRTDLGASLAKVPSPWWHRQLAARHDNGENRWLWSRLIPEKVHTVIAHEPPLIELLPDRAERHAGNEDVIAKWLAGDYVGSWASLEAPADPLGRVIGAAAATEVSHFS
jgi:hypothetical protein